MTGEPPGRCEVFEALMACLAALDDIGPWPTPQPQDLEREADREAERLWVGDR